MFDFLKMLVGLCSTSEGKVTVMAFGVIAVCALALAVVFVALKTLGAGL